VNEAFSRITGYSRDEVLGPEPALLSSGRQDKAFYAAMWRNLIRQTATGTGEIWNRRKNGAVRRDADHQRRRDAQGNTAQYVALFSDITALKEHEQQLEHIAHYDALTGLPNRVLLADRLHQAMAQAQRREQPLAVAYLDLDGFKAINDQHGHEAGDLLLITLASAHEASPCAKAIRWRAWAATSSSPCCSTWPISTASVPMLIRLLDAAAQPVHVGRCAPAGVGQPRRHLLPAGEESMPTNCCARPTRRCIRPSWPARIATTCSTPSRIAACADHHESLEHIRRPDGAGIRAALPAQGEHAQRRVVGAEALIRWQHPDAGPAAAADFLPVIEDHPLAIDSANG
jgi:PAS domain S-box-containing protein